MESSHKPVQNIKITSLSTLMQHAIHYCMQPASAVIRNEYLCSILDFHSKVCCWRCIKFLLYNKN